MKNTHAMFALCMVLAAQTFSTQGIAANNEVVAMSTESQSGQIIAKGVAKTRGGGQTALTQAKGVSSDLATHAAKQNAQALTKPFDRNVRNAGDDPDFWIYDAFVTFDIDNDFDGFYSTFTVEFDADTVFTEAQVYARLYLARGEVFEEFHTTSVFNIFGDSSTDALVVRSDLISGFPSDDYELLIEIYDTFDDSLVAIYDGFNDVDLTLLTLESKSFEETDTVVIVTESGGSFGLLGLLLIPLLIIRRFYYRC